MLQAGRAQVHFPMRLPNFFFFSIYLFLPAALWAQPLTEMSNKNQTFNKEFLRSWMPPSLVWTLHALSSAIVPFKVGFPHVSMPHETLHNCKLQPSMSLLVSRGCRVIQ
jgi:hypothetical protein